MDFDIPDELALLARTARDFVETRLQPIEKQVEDSDEIPSEIVREMAGLGFFGLPFPEECGGVGAGDLGYCLALEQFGRTSAAFSNLIGAHTSIGSMSIYLGGTDEQKRRYLPDLTAGRKLAAFSLTEPSSGSDAASIQTTARKDGGRWLLNGTKIWVTNGPIADVVVVYAANDRAKGARGGITAFIVEKGFKGFRVGKIDEKMGLRGSKTGELILEDCEVPEENVLGAVGNGVNVLMSGLDYERVVLAAGPLGIMQACMDVVIPYVHDRKQFGRPIGQFQIMQAKLADMYVTMNAAKSYVYAVARACDDGRTTREDAAGAILYAAERATWMALEAIQCLGGNGYINDFSTGRLLRDAKLYEIGAGTSEIRRMLIGREIFDKTS